jgi:hypothetical protein
MTRKELVPLLALAALSSCRAEIPIDTQGAEAIPTELALAKLRELLPKAAYLSCTDPRVSLMQSEIRAWALDEEGLEFRGPGKEPFRLAYSAIRGAELAKVLLSFEVRVYVATPTDPRKDLFRFNWREEDPARRATELIEALRGDR